MLGSTLAKPRPTDIAAHLPSPAAARWYSINDARSEAFDLSRALTDRLNEEHLLVQSAEQVIRRMADAVGRPIAEDHPAIVEQRRIIAAAKVEIARLQQIRDSRSEVAQAAGHTASAVEGWMLSKMGDHTFEIVEVDVELKKGETAAQTLDRVQRRGRELQAELHRVRSAPRHSAWAKAKMREQISALAERGRPYVAGLIEHGDEVRFAEASKSARVSADKPALAQWVEPDAMATLAWLHRDALIAALDREIEAEADDESALTDEERAKQEATLLADILHNERVEAELVWRTADDGAPLAFRDGISAEAVLGIAAVAKPPTDAWRPLVSVPQAPAAV